MKSSSKICHSESTLNCSSRHTCIKVSTHNVSGVRNQVNNPDWVVMTNYVRTHHFTIVNFIEANFLSHGQSNVHAMCSRFEHMKGNESNCRNFITVRYSLSLLLVFYKQTYVPLSFVYVWLSGLQPWLQQQFVFSSKCYSLLTNEFHF